MVVGKEVVMIPGRQNEAEVDIISHVMLYLLHFAKWPQQLRQSLLCFSLDLHVSTSFTK